MKDSELLELAAKAAGINGEWAVARAIKLIEQVEAEVHKQDTALIRQMLDVLEWQERPLCMCWAGCGDCNPENAPNAVAAIAAARKRLEGKP